MSMSLESACVVPGSVHLSTPTQWLVPPYPRPTLQAIFFDLIISEQSGLCHQMDQSPMALYRDISSWPRSQQLERSRLLREIFKAFPVQLITELHKNGVTA